MTHRQVRWLMRYLLALSFVLTAGSFLIHKTITLQTESIPLQAAAVLLEVALLMPTARLLSCCGWHQVYPGNCASHVGTRRSLVCLLVEFFMLGSRGHTWKVLGGAKFTGGRRPWSLFYRGVVVWPIGQDRGQRVEPVWCMRSDLPLPSRMHAICTRCGYL